MRRWRNTRKSKQQGAIAGKLTGGGRGGSMIVLATDLEILENIAKCATDLGASYVNWILRR